ncbi:MAG: 23S rRNA (pseudouridine(1915)-N(3))-methyltransferase RlmH [Bacteroidaceae bacterium]|nr:23S rRNA (pseudouridine(1915)-N(3))-methyltransferase RlmH [Bacteroidaceae bacterium]
MKTVLLVVGKTTDRHFAAGIDDYCGRLSHYMPFALEVIPELKATKSLSEGEQKQREGRLILESLQPGDHVVLLDDRGSEYRSVEFAQWMQRRMLSGTKRLVFVVGGPYGFSPDVYQRADEKISLSRMTFSHQMVRLIFVEQLYRAMSILAGESYHHE